MLAIRLTIDDVATSYSRLLAILLTMLLGMHWLHTQEIYIPPISLLLNNHPAHQREGVRGEINTFQRRLPDCLLQQGLSGSDEGGAMTAAYLWLASVLVVVARWSTDLDVIFIISSVRCTTMIEDE
jgi:hypothetical protein